MRVRSSLMCSFTVVALAIAGCTPSATTTAPAATSGTVTSSIVATVHPGPAPDAGGVHAVSTGPITTPAVGSAQRTAILDAVRGGLGTRSQFVVEQLYVQTGNLTPSAAVADLVPVSGGSRVFVAVLGGPSGWRLAWSAAFGSNGANTRSLLSAAPGVSAALAAKLAWGLKPSSGPASSSMLPSWRIWAASKIKGFAGSGYTGGFTFTFKVAKDSKGHWWGNALGRPKTSGLEAIGLWGRYGNGKWTGQVADFSDPGLDAKFFPADVLVKIHI